MNILPGAGEGTHFVSSGDKPAPDFPIGAFSITGGWQQMNLAPYIPVHAIGKLLLIKIEALGNPAGEISLKPKDYFLDVNTGVRRWIKDEQFTFDYLLCTNSMGFIEYKIDVGGWTIINMTIRGWWVNGL